MTERTEYFMTNSLKGMLAQFSEKEKMQVKKVLDYYAEQYEGMKKDLSKISLALSTQRHIEELIETYFSDPKRKDIIDKVSCSSNCPYCCKQIAYITLEEAILLVDTMKQQGLKINRSLLKKQLNAGNEEEWLKLKNSRTRCIFLGKDNNCMVYEHRPIVCRKYFVITPVSYCNVTKRIGGKVASIFNLEVEALATVALTISEAETIPRMIHKILEEG